MHEIMTQLLSVIDNSRKPQGAEPPKHEPTANQIFAAEVIPTEPRTRDAMQNNASPNRADTCPPAAAAEQPAEPVTTADTTPPETPEQTKTRRRFSWFS